jgi:hypothetical protein
MANSIQEIQSLVENGVMRRIFATLQAEEIIAVHVDVLALDSTSCKVHPDGHGALNLGKQAIGKSKGGWNAKLHVVSSDDMVIVEMHLSGGNCHDGPEGRISIATMGSEFTAFLC